MKAKIFTQEEPKRVSGLIIPPVRRQTFNKMIFHCMLSILLITNGLISTPVQCARVDGIPGDPFKITLHEANDAVIIRRESTDYTFTLTSGYWETPPPYVSGVSVNGPVLTMYNSADYSTITIGGGIGSSVTFADSEPFNRVFRIVLSTGCGAVTFDGNIDFTGTNSISIRTNKNIVFNNGSSLTTENGYIILDANQQDTPTEGNFTGIDVNNATVQVTGTGLMIIKAKGGDTTASQIGINVHSGGRIIGGTTGTLTIEGYGGSSSSRNNIGVSVSGGSSPNFSTITSNGCNVSVRGVGGGLAASSSFSNFGILIGKDASATGIGIITSGGDGTVTLIGNGGTGLTGYYDHGIYLCGSDAKVLSGGTGSVSITGTGGISDNNDANNYGVFLDNSATITTGTDGSVTVTGTGGGEGKPSRFEYGVKISNGSKITSQGAAGTVTVIGTGGASTYPANHGVYVTGGTSPNFSTITSGGGNVSVTGTGGGGTNGDNYGIFIDEAAIVTSGSDGSVTVTGNGGGSAGTGANNYGVYVNGKGKITSGGAGNVAVTGTGGNSSGNLNNGVLIKGGTAPDFSSITSGGGNVTVTGTGKGTGASMNHHGVYLGGSNSSKGVITSGGTGSVTVIGTAGNGNTGTDNYGVYVYGANAKILSGGSGSVSVTGTGGGTGSAGFGLGVNVDEGGTITSGTDGSVIVTGHGGCVGGSGMANYGVQAVRGGKITSSGAGGTVTVTGTGSNSSGFRNVGVCVNDHNFLGDTATISSGGGNVTITGTGGGSDTSYYNYGVWLGAADADGSCRVNPGGTGSLTITGQGGTATGSNNFGVYIGGTDAKVLSAGHITITGIEGGSANGYALNMVASGSVRSTGTGSLVKLIGNSMNMASNTSVTAPDGYVNIYPRTAGVNIDLGSANLDKSGPLTFTSTEFGHIIADTITIGSAASDTITISQNLTVSAGSSVKLSTQATGGIIPSASADFSMAGKTLSFGTGTPLRIAINGITVNTDYNQLSVNGTVNLAGTQLSLSGTYTPVDGDVFTIVSATSVTGTFNGLADKTVITFNNQKLRIDYTATAVTLTCVVCSNPTDGGTIAGNQTTCSGSLPAGLTSTSLPTGHTGDLEFQWQSSTTSAIAGFGNIQDAADTTYQPSTLTASTWFRRLARVGCMANWEGCDTSNVVKITVTPAAFSISGTARYENNPKTPLNGLKIILKKLESGTWIKVDSAETNNLGFYDFDGLTNATYGLTIKSAHPSGQWQTWNGVNNTDYLIVNQHINGVNLLPVNPPVIRVTASTKELHPLINSQDAIAIRQAAKFPGTGWQYFDIPKWVFSGITADTRLDTIVLACADVTRDIRGLCAGDVNGTYMPLNGYKVAGPDLQLVNQETLPLASEIVFPVRADRDLSLGAITLLLDYDPSRIEITGVEMPGNDGVEPWFDAQNGVLNIGWMSTDGAYVPEGGVVMLIRAKMKITMSKEQLTMSSRGEPIRFSLNESPLSEIADVYGNVLNSIKLSIPDASSKPFVHSSLLIAHCSLTAVYPNPVEDFLNLQFMAENATTVTIGLFNLPGKNVIPSETVNITPGINIKSLDLSKLSNGAYLMKVTMNNHTETRKVIVNR